MSALLFKSQPNSASAETVTEKDVEAMSNLIALHIMFGLPSFQAGFLFPLTLALLESAALIKHNDQLLHCVVMSDGLPMGSGLKEILRAMYPETV